MKKFHNLKKMEKLFLGLLLFAFTPCNSQSKEAIRDQIAKGDRSDSEQESPSQREVRKGIIRSYNDIIIIDTTLISGNDSLHFLLKYYCLKNSILVVPKSYDTDKKNPKDFSTHAFASSILLTNKKDTVLNKEFKESDFMPFFQDNFGGNLKKYGSLIMPELSRRNKDSNKIVLAYSIAIPTTDIGIGVYLIISKNGNYKIVENYQ